MKRSRLSSGIAIGVCGLMLTTTVGAQQHVIDREMLDQLVEAKVAENEAHRETIRHALEHPEVARVADRLGIDLRQVSDGVATLEGEELADVAARAQDVDEALSGGQSTVTFSTTTIIIALLVIILIIVAVN